jgi:pyridoxine 5-phosphate synthase
MTAATISGLPEIVELNIGHFLIGEAVFVGLGETVRLMRAAMDTARGSLRAADTLASASGAP